MSITDIQDANGQIDREKTIKMLESLIAENPTVYPEFTSTNLHSIIESEVIAFFLQRCNSVQVCSTGINRMRVCAPGYIGPANIVVVLASDYDAKCAELESLKLTTERSNQLKALDSGEPGFISKELADAIGIGGLSQEQQARIVHAFGCKRHHITIKDGEVASSSCAVIELPMKTEMMAVILAAQLNVPSSIVTGTSNWASYIASSVLRKLAETNNIKESNNSKPENEDYLTKLAASQEALGTEFQEALNSNLSNLYLT